MTTDLTTRRAHISEHNFIILNEATAMSNDSRHDAGHDAVAYVLGEDACRRLVACWNACSGVPTDDLECNPALFSALRFERDELLAMLRRVVGGWRAGDDIAEPMREAQELLGLAPASPPAAAQAAATGGRCPHDDCPSGEACDLRPCRGDDIGKTCATCGFYFPF